MTDFLVIPAVDLRGGRCVRLRRGDFREETVFDKDPVKVGKRWEEEGARMLHVVDLDGARAGEPVNHEVARGIMGEVSIPVQVGGGIRSVETAEWYLSEGADRVVVGTRAFEDPEWTRTAAEVLGDKMVVGMDVEKGKPAVSGWTRLEGEEPAAAVERLAEAGVKRIIYTCVSRDGTMDGPDLAGIEEISRKSPVPLIVSGGISVLGDLVRLYRMRGSGIEGAIVGTALYRGKFTLEGARLALEEVST